MNDGLNCLVIGFGSIGSKHALLLNQMGHNVSVVSKHGRCEFPQFAGIDEAFKGNAFDYIVVSNNTCDHYETIISLIKYGYNKKLLVEKPLFENVKNISNLNNKNIYVGFNLRFHPIINDLKLLMKNRDVYSLQVYVGQYLPQWRPCIDYRKCYSADKKKGGGVLRDLCHELDYVNWMTQGWKRLSAIGGTFGNLEINSDDVFCMLIETEKCPAVQVQMNYLDKTARREIIVNMENISVKADLIKCTMEINDETKKYGVCNDDTYSHLHNAIIGNRTENVCTFQQGMDVLQMIECIEEAGSDGRWIER